MNNSIHASGLLVESVNGVSYFAGLLVSIFFLIATIVVASFYCKKVQTLTRPSLPQQRSYIDSQGSPSASVEIGLDETTLQSYPSLLYSEAKLENKDNVSCCSICLSDYRNTDVLRQLPDCEHRFHLKCVDPWLRLHPTCPVCRSTPTPTPLSTPLAEVVPLAHQQV